MAEQLTVEQAVERAMRAQDEKIEAIRELAQGRQALTDARDEAAQKLADLEQQNAAQIGAAEREDLRLYGAATKAGWSAEELRKIGFEEPAKLRRMTRRKRSSAARSTSAAAGAAGQSNGSKPTTQA